MSDGTAVVVGSGPNGLAAAISLAAAGMSVTVFEARATPGGGLRSAESTLPGFRHDVCATVHAMAAAGTLFAELGLAVEWCEPEVLLAHPLDDGRAGVLLRSVEETSVLNASPRWSSLIGSLPARWHDIEHDVLGPLWRRPRRPRLLAQLGLRSLPPATAVSAWLKSAEAGALFAGIAAHTISDLRWPMSSSAGVGLAAVAHAAGWPFATGGSQTIADAMVQRLRDLGGTLVCDSEVHSLADLPPADAVLFDLPPRRVLDIAGESVPRHVHRRWVRHRTGAAAFKLDYALAGAMPWTNPDARRAGTIHLGGAWQEVAAAESAVRRGRVPEKPFVLVTQPSVVDPSRAPADHHTLWAYCHVPNGCSVDMTGAVESQFDRFAPDWRDLVLHRSVTTPADLERYNPNCIGGSIDGGAVELHRVLLRPDSSVDPYRIGSTRLWMCGSSTPPGPGVHGLCGRHAAASVLRSSRGDRRAGAAGDAM